MSEAAEANAALIRRFYAALDARDAATMAACYAPGATFSDPVFPQLDTAGVGAMWSMLCERGKDLRVDLRDVVTDDDSGRASWTAHYTFAATGRKVANEIESSFALREGRILRQVDRFGVWRWARQALGITGLLLGWSPLFAGRIRSQAAQALAQWRGRRGGTA